MATDYISRADLLERLGIDDLDCTKCSWGDRHGFVCKRGCDFQDACEAIEDAEPADVVERKRGKWERKLVPVCDDGIIMIPGNVCSECGGITTYNVSLFKYCPRCGARMVTDDG